MLVYIIQNVLANNILLIWIVILAIFCNPNSGTAGQFQLFFFFFVPPLKEANFNSTLIFELMHKVNKGSN